MNQPIVFECKDTSERIDFYENYGLYIKPIARLNITIQLPPAKNPGQAASNAEIIDKLKKQSAPEEFIYLRVIKSTFEFIRCEGEIENKSALKGLLSRLDGCAIKMNQYTDVLKVRAAESKIAYPTRHDWDTFFKEDMVVEQKPGERPDTVHLMDVPCRWFADRKSFDKEKPNEFVLREVFSIFGEIRLVDIPMLSHSISSSLKKPYSMSDLSMSPSANCLNLSTFEAFIQYKDYISFVKAMDTFRGMKLLHIDENKNACTANIRVDFDRTKHLSDKEIKKREIDKLKAIEMEKIKTAQLEKEKEKEAKQREIANFRALLEESVCEGTGGKDEKSKEQRRREREEIRRQKKLAKKQQEEEKKLEQKIALEERKILIAQRKLESMRLLEELFNRVKVMVAQEEKEKKLKELKEVVQRREIEEAEQENIKRIKLEQDEIELREKVERNLKSQAEKDTAMNMASPKSEPEEFELRKKPLESSPSYASSPSQVAMPRSLLLSNPQLTQSQLTAKPKLYDEDDMSSRHSDSALLKEDTQKSNVSNDENSNTLPC